MLQKMIETSKISALRKNYFFKNNRSYPDDVTF